MKKVIMLSILIMSSRLVLAQTDTNAYKFILDYQIPTSPAFNILDISPQQVTRGGAAKPLVINLFSDFLQTQKLNPGIAVDFSPYLLLGGGFKNLNDYKTNKTNRILANTLFSIATVKNKFDSSNTDIGLGVRITLHDDHDLFANSATLNSITTAIGNALSNAAVAPVTNGGVPDDNIGSAKSVDLKNHYTKAYNDLRKEKGTALSVGAAYKTTSKKSIISSDSLIDKYYKVWGSFSKYTVFPGADLLTILQGKFADNSDPEWILGFALTSQTKNNNLTAEAVYNFLTKKWDYGGNFEIKLFDKLSYIFSIGKRSTFQGMQTKDYLGISSNFRISLFGN